jgi:hypothetical protein
MSSLRTKVKFNTKPRTENYSSSKEESKALFNTRESMKPKLVESYSNIDLQRKAMGVKELYFPDAPILSSSVHKPRTENFQNNSVSNNNKKLSTSQKNILKFIKDQTNYHEDLILFACKKNNFEIVDTLAYLKST